MNFPFKFNLTFKFFTVFLVASLVIILLMVITMKFFVFRNFSDYVNRVELEKLNTFSDALKEEYKKKGSWKRFSTNPMLFMHTFSISMLGEDLPFEPPFHFMPPKHGAPAGMHMPDRRPPDFSKPPPDNIPPPWDQKEFKHERGGMGEKKPPDADKEHLEKGPDPAFRDMQRIVSRLMLFDEKKHPVFGRSTTPDHYTLQAIEIKEKPVGWLGLRHEDILSNPLDARFLRQQEKAFYLMGTIILIMVAGISFLLARHILTPIHQLAKGTHALTNFRFNTKISVRSKDELGQLARDFNRMSETLNKYEKLRGQWLSDISHELRTPLTILRGDIEAVQDGIRKMDKGALDSFHAEVLHLNQLVDELHLLSLADAGNLDFRKDPVDPFLILNRALDRFQAPFKLKGISIIYEQEKEKSPLVTGDEDRLEHLFSNLLENTLRYTDAPGNLHIRSELSDKELFFIFEDSAPGVPDESLGRLFDRLYRVDKSRSRLLGGSGLGLSICKEIVKYHGGSIIAEHSSLGGIKIIITIPLTKKL